MTWLDRFAAHPALRDRDWFLPLWLSSSTFRRCWRTFGRAARAQPYLQADVRVRSFHTVAHEALLRPVAANPLRSMDDTHPQEGPLHAYARDLPPNTTLHAIEFTSAPAPDDARRVARRVLVAYGDPSSRSSVCTEGVDIACWLP